MPGVTTASGRRVAVVFGGESVEHEVSVITAMQVIAALGATSHEVVPLYISKAGRWLTGSMLTSVDSFRDLDELHRVAEPVWLSVDPAQPGVVVAPGRRRTWLGARPADARTVPVDVVLPVTHGGAGENGALQGLLEMAGLPYAGSGVAASAVCMDKPLAKTVLRAAGLPVLPDVVAGRARLAAGRDDLLAEIEDRIGYPAFVKPVGLGSSIAAGAAGDREELVSRLEVAALYDGRLMIESAQTGATEVNCAVLGDASSARPSVCEQPLSEGMLTYQDKYAAGGKGKGKGMQSARRLIPAPIGDELTAAVQDAAVRAFQAVGAAGVARVDLFVDPASGTLHVNEINTIPGSLAFYLWEPAGLSFPALLEELIGLAGERHAEAAMSERSIPSWLLASGASGAKLAGSPVGADARG
jgi:D-alanine-D-alanine ligase